MTPPLVCHECEIMRSGHVYHVYAGQVDLAAERAVQIHDWTNGDTSYTDRVVAVRPIGGEQTLWRVATKTTTSYHATPHPEPR